MLVAALSQVGPSTSVPARWRGSFPIRGQTTRAQLHVIGTLRQEATIEAVMGRTIRLYGEKSSAASSASSTARTNPTEAARVLHLSDRRLGRWGAAGRGLRVQHRGRDRSGSPRGTPQISGQTGGTRDARERRLVID